MTNLDDLLRDFLEDQQEKLEKELATANDELKYLRSQLDRLEAERSTWVGRPVELSNEDLARSWNEHLKVILNQRQEVIDEYAKNLRDAQEKYNAIQSKLCAIQIDMVNNGFINTEEDYEPDPWD